MNERSYLRYNHMTEIDFLASFRPCIFEPYPLLFRRHPFRSFNAFLSHSVGIQRCSCHDSARTPQLYMRMRFPNGKRQANNNPTKPNFRMWMEESAKEYYFVRITYQWKRYTTKCKDKFCALMHVSTWHISVWPI